MSATPRHNVEINDFVEERFGALLDVYEERDSSGTMLDLNKVMISFQM